MLRLKDGHKSDNKCRLSSVITSEELTRILNFITFRHGKENVLQCES